MTQITPAESQSRHAKRTSDSSFTAIVLAAGMVIGTSWRVITKRR